MNTDRYYQTVALSDLWEYDTTRQETEASSCRYHWILHHNHFKR
jgi:hypothetical protein